MSDARWALVVACGAVAFGTAISALAAAEGAAAGAALGFLEAPADLRDSKPGEYVPLRERLPDIEPTFNRYLTNSKPRPRAPANCAPPQLQLQLQI